MAEHAEAHHHPNYVKIWVILVALLIVSVLGPMLGIKAVTIITAFGVAVVKAYLVARNFMHVNIEPKFVVYALSTALAFMALLFFLVAPDVMKHDGQRWVNLAAKNAANPPPPVVQVKGPFDPRATFSMVCGTCHGANGGGDGPVAIALDPKPANFNDAEFWKTRDRDHLIKVITEGGAAVGKSSLMVGYGATYSAEEIAALADHVLTFRPAGAGGP